MKFQILFLSLLFIPSAGFAQSKIRYPVVTIANGKVDLIDGEKVKPLKLSESLKEKAIIRVGDKSQVRIDLSANTSALILENSEVVLPFIAWEDGRVEQIELKKGRLHVVIGNGDNKTVVTALSRDYLKSGEYIFTYEPLVPQIETVVLSGELEFRGLENEEFVKIKTGEKASFVGVLESGEPVYDVLLKGRKVARGKLNQVQKLSAVDLGSLKKQVQVKKVLIKKAKAAPRTEVQICTQPNAELNQCSWVCENNPKKSKDCNLSGGAVCARYRCNANGEWAERTELTRLESKCTLRPLVLACDY